MFSPISTTHSPFSTTSIHIHPFTTSSTTLTHHSTPEFWTPTPETPWFHERDFRTLNPSSNCATNMLSLGVGEMQLRGCGAVMYGSGGGLDDADKDSDGDVVMRDACDYENADDDSEEEEEEEEEEKETIVVEGGEDYERGGWEQCGNREPWR
ncbi:hypothetical protein EX30DRAFT_393503 [Ascodesmis nigricans]|uniref:Uncharacterized protein n=1 Tax=Ascodesmis nigricans TaxID=341454 RepID=A0A4S2N4F7_9PEZI|nr:hypothetical protein EX30DRAFT_393503 [Ascodesmis nigricans]